MFGVNFQRNKEIVFFTKLTKSRAYTTEDRPTLRAIERSFTEFES